MFTEEYLIFKKQSKSTLRERVEYLYSDKYWVFICRQCGQTTIEFLCNGFGPTADVCKDEIFFYNDQFNQKISITRLDEYVQNAYLLRELAEYVRDNTEILLKETKYFSK